MQIEKQKNWQLVQGYGLPVHMCPTCSVYPQFLHCKEDDTFAIRCPSCGYEVSWPKSLFDSSYTQRMAHLFNVGIMALELGEDMMLLYGVENGDYLVYSKKECVFLQGFKNVLEAIEFMRNKKEQDLETVVYYLWDNHLNRMFGSFVFDAEKNNQ